MAAQSRSPRFLLTRPAAQGARFGQTLRNRFPGAEVVESPLLAPCFFAPSLPQGPFAAAIFTSETGVEAARRLGPPLADRAFCVGTRTTTAAGAAGYCAQSAEGDADDLLETILAAAPTGRLIHLHGQETRGNLVEKLNSAGLETLSLTLYAQKPQPFSQPAKTFLAAGGALFVPLFSPRTAVLFSTGAKEAKASLHVAALSPAVANALQLQAAALETAARPDADAMLDVLDALVERAGGA